MVDLTHRSHRSLIIMRTLSSHYKVSFIGSRIQVPFLARAVSSACIESFKWQDHLESEYLSQALLSLLLLHNFDSFIHLAVYMWLFLLTFPFSNVLFLIRLKHFQIRVNIDLQFRRIFLSERSLVSAKWHSCLNF